MKIKTGELTGAALDWAVAKIEGREFEDPGSFLEFYDEGGMRYSIEWAMGGPIIEREKISLTPFPNCWEAQGAGVHYRDDALQTGDTPLIAAMRCLVASKLGDEIDVPDELV